MSTLVQRILSPIADEDREDAIEYCQRRAFGESNAPDKRHSVRRAVMFALGAIEDRATSNEQLYAEAAALLASGWNPGERVEALDPELRRDELLELLTAIGACAPALEFVRHAPEWASFSEIADSALGGRWGWGWLSWLSGVLLGWGYPVQSLTIRQHVDHAKALTHLEQTLIRRVPLRPGTVAPFLPLSDLRLPR
jgi:hypothetical protein